MDGRRLLVICAFGAFLTGQPARVLAQQPGHPAFDAAGFQPHRDYFSEMPFENVDTLSGGLVLRFTDLVLPGNAGRELRFERTYNSKTREWSFGVAGVAMRIYTPAPPPFGGPQPGPQDVTPVLYMSDGSQRKLAWYESPNVQDPNTFNRAISSDFWLFDRTGTTRKLYIPNGDVCEYESDTTDYVRVSTCRDAFGNTIGFQWLLSANPPELRVTQSLSTDVAREITIVLST